MWVGDDWESAGGAMWDAIEWLLTDYSYDLARQRPLQAYSDGFRVYMPIMLRE